MHQDNSIENPYVPLENDQLYERLKKSREDSENGKVRDADAVIADLKKKYGL